MHMFRFMLELTTEQCNEYVRKIVSLAEIAGCTVCIVCYLYVCAICVVQFWMMNSSHIAARIVIGPMLF